MSHPWRIFFVADAIVLALLIYFNQHATAHAIGIDTQQSDNYAFTSGPGPMIETFIFGLGIFAPIWKFLNCHSDGCPWIGRFHVAGGSFRVCRKHHSEVTGHPLKLTTELIRLAHHRHVTGEK